MELLSVLRTGVAESLTMLAAMSTACTWTGQVSIWIKCNADVGGIQTCLVCQILTLVVSVQNNSIFQLILHNKTLWYFIKYEYICIYQMIYIFMYLYMLWNYSQKVVCCHKKRNLIFSTNKYVFMLSWFHLMLVFGA